MATPSPDKIMLIMSNLYRVQTIARNYGVTQSTLDWAVKNDKCRSYKTADGLPLLTLGDFHEWFETVYRGGPKLPAKKKRVKK